MVVVDSRAAPARVGRTVTATCSPPGAVATAAATRPRRTNLAPTAKPPGDQSPCAGSVRGREDLPPRPDAYAPPPPHPRGTSLPTTVPPSSPSAVVACTTDPPRRAQAVHQPRGVLIGQHRGRGRSETAAELAEVLRGLGRTAGQRPPEAVHGPQDGLDVGGDIRVRHPPAGVNRTWTPPTADRFRGQAPSSGPAADARPPDHPCASGAPDPTVPGW